METSIFEVTRDDYKSFFEQIKPECRRVEVEKLNYNHISTKTYSKKTGKCLCSKVTYNSDNEENYTPEKYYIFEFPDDDERRPPIPHVKVELKTKEEVQAFFDFLAKQKENG